MRLWGILQLAVLVVPFPAACAATFEELAAQAARAREAGNAAQAISLYREALQQNPKWDEGWWFVGTLAYDANQYALGEEAFRHFVALDAQAAPGWALLGLCEFENGHIEASLEHLRRAEAIGGLPKDTADVVRFHEAMALTGMGRFDEAMDELTEFVRAGVKNEELTLAVGAGVLRRRVAPREIAAKDRALFAAAGEAESLWMLGQTKEAEARLAELVKRFPDAPGVHCLYGLFLQETRPEAAMAEFRRELQIDPENADARAVAALAQFAYGKVLAKLDEADAVARLQAAVRLDPENLEYHMALAEAASRFGDVREARRERVRSIELARGSGKSE
jgi:tetratricopeptide (TPR) repeat protein